jgi:hypothetical protein
MRALPADGSGPRMGTTRSGAQRAVRVDPTDTGQGPRSRWLAALSTVGVLVLLAVCGLGTYFIAKDEGANATDAGNTGGAASTNPPQRDISSRAADPAPLNEAEVFPAQQVRGEPPYLVLKTQVTADCGQAAADELGKLFTNNGCNQVVRGTLKTTDGAYLVTAGIFNMKDEQGAIASHENIKPIVDANRGRFTGLLAGAGTEALLRAPMILGWHARGHYLAYCVIARTDGKGFDPGNQIPTKIQNDILTVYLRDGVIGARTVQKAGAPAATPAAS